MRKKLVRELFSLGLSQREISERYPGDPSVSSIIKECGGSIAFPNRPNKKGVYAAIFRAYAEFTKIDASKVLLGEGRFEAIQKAIVLASYIGESEFLSQIRGMTFAAAATFMPAIPSDRLGYADLAREMGLLRRIDPDDLTDATRIWDAFLGAIAQGELRAPESPAHASMMLAHDVLDPCRAGMKTFWTEEAFMLFDLAIATLKPSVQRIIRQRFGLDGKAPMSAQEIAESEFVKTTRIRSVLKSAINKLRMRHRHFGLHLLVEPVGKLLQRELKRRLPESKAAREPTPDVLTLEVELEVFPNLPIAARRRLKDADITRIGDLVTMNRVGVLRLVRRRSMQILSELLEERGLSFGMNPNLPAIVTYRERLAAS